MKVLRIKIYQPEANYRVPFSYQKRFTYPIPPYSTVKGLICNLMGIESDSDEDFKNIKNISLGIYGTFDNMIKDYIWFRNLSKDSHKGSFVSLYNRTMDFTVRHPGGQIPVKIDTLNSVNLIIYIYHRDIKFLEKIKEAFINPIDRNSTISLGRAEDWLVFNEIKEIELTTGRIKDVNKIDYYTWIPNQEYILNNCCLNNELYNDFFNKVDGNLFRLPTFYEIIDNKRVFDNYIESKLYEKGSLTVSPFDKSYLLDVLIDDEEGLPLFLTDLGEMHK